MKTAHFINKDITTSQNLALAPLSYTTTIDKSFKLEKVLFVASQAISETVTVSAISADGTIAVLAQRTLVAKTDYVYMPAGEDNFLSGDQIKVQCTNANGIGTMKCIIKTSEM